jgi:hypothetical protein
MCDTRKLKSTLLTKLCFVGLTLITLTCQGQGTFIYDQQSSTETNYQEGGADIQQNQLIGQSFTPQFTSIRFIRLSIYNGLLGDTTLATVHINLRSNSISGLILGSTIPVSISAGSLFAGPVDFFFSSEVPVVPGVTYYFQPVVENNNNLGLNQSASYNYLQGTAYFLGVASLTHDLWFREGIYVVPEPSALSLLIGGGVLFCFRRSRIRRSLIARHANYT